MAILMRNGVFPPLAAAVGVLIAVICASLIGAASILFQAPSFIISLRICNRKQSTSGIFSRHKCRSEKVDLFRPERHLCWSRGNAFALEGRRGSAKHRDGNRVASDRFSRDRRCPYDGWQRKYSWNILRRFALGGDWKRFEYDAR